MKIIVFISATLSRAMVYHKSSVSLYLNQINNEIKKNIYTFQDFRDSIFLKKKSATISKLLYDIIIIMCFVCNLFISGNVKK